MQSRKNGAEVLRLATRGSALALAQAETVKQLFETEIKKSGENCRVELLTITTAGDRDRKSALSKIGGKGLFVRGIEEALLDGRADLAVHSSKDLPYELCEGLVIAGVPAAAPPEDLLIIRPDSVFAARLLHGPAFSDEERQENNVPVIGTGSPRRVSELEALIGPFEAKENRGNISTRIRKLTEGQFDAIVLARAGVERLHLDLSNLLIRAFSAEEMIPACGQGILAVECRRDDERMIRLLKGISDERTRMRFDIERCLFKDMRADCATALGVFAEVEENGHFTLTGMYDGHKECAEGRTDDYSEVCAKLARALMKTSSSGSPSGTVTLVGGGCGPSLMTEEGVEAVSHAEVLLYDDLVDFSCLQYAPKNCECVYVGKRYGRHSRKQEEINDLLIQYASEGKKVVRLKGGDPFVFGRGGEEVLALQKAGIACEALPGISSAIAVPEHLGIPVTHRKMARSFTVVTGHTADGTGEDFEALAHLKGTLVFLMGLHAAPTISEELIRFGKDPETPCAILSRGFSPEEKRRDCTLEHLAETAAKAEDPAVIVVGEVVSFHMESPIRRPLERCTVGVTGSEGFIQKMTGRLKEEGAGTIGFPTLSLVAEPKAIPDDFTGVNWLVFTSSNGVNLFFKEMKARKFDIRRLFGLKFAVIGKGTAEKLASYGIYADFVPSVYESGVLGRELAEKIIRDGKSDDKVWILRAENGSKALTDALDARQIDYKDIGIYRAEAADHKDDVIRNEALKKADFLTFSSAAGVRAFFKTAELPEKAQIVAIGPLTAEEFRRHSDRPCFVPKSYTAEAMIDLMRNCMLRR